MGTSKSTQPLIGCHQMTRSAMGLQRCDTAVFSTVILVAGCTLKHKTNSWVTFWSSISIYLVKKWSSHPFLHLYTSASRSHPSIHSSIYPLNLTYLWASVSGLGWSIWAVVCLPRHPESVTHRSLTRRTEYHLYTRTHTKYDDHINIWTTGTQTIKM